MKQGRFLASAVAVGFVTAAFTPAAADTCLTQPNTRAEGGHWYYRVDRATHRRCWYQQGGKTTAVQSETSSAVPTSSAAQSAAPPSPDGVGSVLSSIAAAMSGQAPNPGTPDESAKDRPSAEPVRVPSSRSHGRTKRNDVDRSAARRAKDLPGDPPAAEIWHEPRAAPD